MEGRAVVAWLLVCLFFGVPLLAILLGGAPNTIGAGHAQYTDSDGDGAYYHRDVNPKNIMMTGIGAVLIDFGLAKKVRAGKDLSFSRGGSPGWSPIEREKGESGGFTDPFSLGQVLWHMLTGSGTFHSLDVGEIENVLSEEMTKQG